MKTPFFQQYGNEITFQNHSDLIEKFSHIDCSVPKRTCGRRSSHTERYDLKFYLERLPEKCLLKFPFSVRKEESPDFILSNNETITALEVTEATTESFQKAQTKQETEPEGTWLELNPSFNLESSEKRDKKVQWKAIGEAMRKRGEKLRGEGWLGDSGKKEWVEIILSAIKKKTEKLNQPRFKNADRYELLIYDGSHVGSIMLDVGKAVPLLKKAVNEKLDLISSKRNFHFISIIRGNQLLYDITNEYLIIEKQNLLNE